MCGLFMCRSGEIFAQVGREVGGGDTDLFHCIAVAQSYGFRLLLNGFEVHGQAQRGADFVMTAVVIVAGVLMMILGIIQCDAADAELHQLLLQLVAFGHNFGAVFLERNNRNLYRREVLL